MDGRKGESLSTFGLAAMYDRSVPMELESVVRRPAGNLRPEMGCGAPGHQPYFKESHHVRLLEELMEDCAPTSVGYCGP